MLMFCGFHLEREFECNFISVVPGSDFPFFAGNSLLLAEFRASLRGQIHIDSSMLENNLNSSHKYTDLHSNILDQA